MPKILVIEDDYALAPQVVEALRANNYLVDHAGNGADGHLYLSAAMYDLVILDWELPDTTGIEICRRIRNSPAADVPVLFLTARASGADKTHGFETGGDDYLTKPFHMPELLARVKSLLRRPSITRPNRLTVRDVVLDTSTREVFQNGESIELFPMEFSLLEFLMSHPRQIFTADNLLRAVWPTDSNSSPETVRTTLMRIRQKIKSPDAQPLIVTLRHIGYRLDL